MASYSWSILKGIFERFSISFCGISPDSRMYEIKQRTHFRSFIGDPACFFKSVESNTWFNFSESVSEEGSKNLYLISTCLALQKVPRQQRRQFYDRSAFASLFKIVSRLAGREMTCIQEGKCLSLYLVSQIPRKILNPCEFGFLLDCPRGRHKRFCKGLNRMRGGSFLLPRTP